MNNSKYQILLTNDDGIQSPGLWKAAEYLSQIGFVTIAAPREQSSGAGRSLPVTSDGKITVTKLQIGDQQWDTYAVGGTPAQSVLHAIYEIMPEKPDLVVSGINYGENLGNSITISGTVGGALEGASCGVPSIAVSLQLQDENYLEYSDIDFSTSAYFTRMFAKFMLENKMPYDVDLLKIDVPANATPETDWRITSLAKHRYYSPAVRRKGSWDDPGAYIGGVLKVTEEELDKGSDAHTMAFRHQVSVTPLSLDMTSRTSLELLEKKIRESQQENF